MGEPRVRRHLVEERRAHEHSVRERRIVGRTAARDDRKALLATELEVREHLLVLPAVDDRARLGRLVLRRADLHRVHPLAQTPDELLVQRAVHEQA